MLNDLDRRRLLTVLAVGTAAALAGCARPGQALTATGAPAGPVPRPIPAPPPPVRVVHPAPTHQATTAPAATEQAPHELVSDPPPVAGLPEVITHLPATALPGAIALTIDDGFSSETVAAYVAFAQASGVHLTFNPNGMYGPIWDKHAFVLRGLIDAGQVQIGNHTFSHKDMRRLSDRKLTEEIERNDAWIQQTFGVTSRPYLRPPFGFRNQRTDQVAGELGYPKVLMWNGSFGDAAVLTEEVLLAQARKWLRPGVLMLGHANHPTITHLYPQLLALIAERGLTPQTLDEAFGTSRDVGF
ncbi:MAG: polysaccharide deacetylase [Frankiales bacterium]|nr:polysaccharide deacetylase [Frankiales bacterium]